MWKGQLVSMPDKKQEKKRRRRNTKNSESATKETKETKGQKSSAKKMASSSGINSGSGVGAMNSGGNTLPSNFPVSSLLNIPYPLPRFPEYSNVSPISSTYSSSSVPQVTSINSQPQPQPQPQPPQNDFSLQLSSQLNFIMSKVSKLDGIEAQQSTILTRLNSIEAAVSENKRMIESTNSKMVEIEKSQTFLSDRYDKLSKSLDVNNTDISKVQNEVKSLTQKNIELKKANQLLSDDVTDLKCRSMRDNLVIVGIPEVARSISGFMGAVGGADQREHMDTAQVNGHNEQASQPRSYAQVASGEDCNAKVWEFCETVLKISNARERVHIDRAHRSGPYKPDKPRVLIVKFKDTDSKMLVKNAARQIDLKQTPFGVFDQYPPEVQEKRKGLIPIMLKARDEHKKAVLVRDKLYINNKLYDPSAE